MRILDSNTDFYDFYQNIYRDNSITFDRRDSFVLTKEAFASAFVRTYFPRWHHAKDKPDYKHALLQVGNKFWLFELSITKVNNFDICVDYTMRLVGSWKDYTVAAECIKLSVVRFDTYGVRWAEDNKRIEAIKGKEYGEIFVFGRHRFFNSTKDKQPIEKKTIPILREIGITKYVSPLDIYLALEEYFSRKITDQERTESIGLTDKERIENHGFDLKQSFRGKVK